MTSTTPCLTPRQLQILELMAEGLTRPQIATRLWLGVHTVATHQRRVYARLGVHTGHGAVAAGYKAGLLREPATSISKERSTMPEPSPEQMAAGRQIAYRIRAELVCCNVYGRVNDSREITFEQAKKSPHWHGLCYWGEASARIAEAPERWQDDPTDHDWSGPDVVQRRARRNIENSQGAQQ